MIKKILPVFVSFFLLLLTGCGPDVPDNPPDVTVGQGVMILNEGNFTYANSTLSFYDPEADTVSNYLFYRANGSPIGDTGQSLCAMDGKLYIVVNGSGYIYKVDAKTICCDTTKPYILADLASPRYMIPISHDKAYVSDLMSKQMWIINPQTMSLMGSIEMGKPTETMVQVGSEVYVANWSRFYANDIQNNSVQVVDARNDIKVAEIEVGYEPKGMVVDKNGTVWVMCEGDANDFDVPSTLWKIDSHTRVSSLVKTFERRASSLAVDPTGSILYYCHTCSDFTNTELRRMYVDNPSYEDDFCIPSEGRTFYTIAVDPRNGELYVPDAKNYVMNGTVYRYTSDGLLLSSFDAGISPGFFLFVN